MLICVAAIRTIFIPTVFHRHVFPFFICFLKYSHTTGCDMRCVRRIFPPLPRCMLKYYDKIRCTFPKINLNSLATPLEIYDPRNSWHTVGCDRIFGTTLLSHSAQIKSSTTSSFFFTNRLESIWRNCSHNKQRYYRNCKIIIIY